MSSLTSPRRLSTFVVVLLAALALGTEASHAAPLDLASLSGAQEEQMLKAGTITSVQLTQAYLDRINGLNKEGPALNAVTQLNKDALQEAADSDRLRAEGVDLGPAMGLPILLKDIVDAKGQYTSAGNWSLRNSFPAEDSGVAAYLRQHGVIILGKAGLSEFANFFGGQPSGFGDLTGQVLNANDADATPSGSSSGTGAAIQSSMSSLGIGTETSGSIISPSQAEGIVGLRPTVGLVPGYGIAPIIASQDTAGPMERTVTDAAMTLQSITGDDSAIEAEADQEYRDVFGSDYIAQGIIPARPTPTPDYMSALTTSFVQGKRIGYTFTAPSSCATPQTVANNIAFCALQGAGATLVHVTQATLSPSYPGIQSIEVHKTIDGYYAHLGPDAPIKSMADEVADNNANPFLAEKFGNYQHWINEQTDDTGSALTNWRASLATAKQNVHANFDAVFNGGTPSDPSDDVVGVLGSMSNAPQAGYPQITIPMGYSATQRRALNASIFGPAYSERNLIGIGYVLEQATGLRQPAEQLNPSMYRCAHLAVPAPFASRGSCNPNYETASNAAGTTDTPDLGFKLETASISDLQSRMAAGTLTSVALTKAYLNRIALTNAQGPGLQAVRSLNADALAEARAADDARAAGRTGTMLGIPVLLDDAYDVAGMTTSAGSIALQSNRPDANSVVVTKLKHAGAVILGKTNVTEFNNFFDTNITQGYSSLGGQVLDSYDTDKTPAGSSAGSASALSSGLAAATIGLQTQQNGAITSTTNNTTRSTTSQPAEFSADAILPASVMGVDALKPTVGRISRVGVLGVAKAQDSPTPMARTITGLAQEMNVLAGIDTSDSEQVASAATPPDYASGLSTDLSAYSVGILSTTAQSPSNTNLGVPNTPGYNDAVSAVTAAGGTTSTKTVPDITPAGGSDASVLAPEFKRDLNAYLAAGHSGASGSLSDVVNYVVNHATEGLKYSSTGVTGGTVSPCNSTTAQLPSQLCAALNAADPSSSDVTTSRTDYASDIPLVGVDALLVPASSPVVGYADKAGYPVLEMQSGYQFTFTSNSNFGQPGFAPNHDPYGVALIGAPDSESTLLKIAYGMEQQLNTQTQQSITQNTTEGNIVYTDAHVAPSVYNPAVFRCIAGSVYYAPYNCHPGEIGYVSPVTAPVEPSTATGSGTSTGTDTSGAGGGSATTPAPSNAGPSAADLGAFVDAIEKVDLRMPLKTIVTRRTAQMKVGDTFVEPGTVTYHLELVVQHKRVVLTTTTKTFTSAGLKTVVIRLSTSVRRLLNRHPTAGLILHTRFVGKPTGKAITTDRLYRRHR
ncbi:MAG: amidase [Solirubrobacteraceae bacterium]|nr:amidase [Solirubrobacteraceae bacterium]